VRSTSEWRHDGAAISSAVLTLVPRAMDVAGRHRHGSPSFDGPTRVVDVRGVFIAGDFTANRPVEAEGGWWMHRRATNRNGAWFRASRVRLSSCVFSQSAGVNEP
jgi:hypothetical protein